MSEPKVFGKFCGLGCKALNLQRQRCLNYKIKTLDWGSVYGYPLNRDKETCRFERCPQCLAEHPVEVKDA